MSRAFSPALATSTDVLVIGGGPAGCWAAWTAHAAGARVILVDKGYVGTSGATAAGNTTIIHTRQGTPERQASVDQRLRLGHGLVDEALVQRVLDRTYDNLGLMAEWGYPFPSLEDGRPYRGMLRGPDYLRFMRQRLVKAGVRVLDHSPAESLLLADTAVAGARGHNRQTGEDWEIRAGAVVLASGGCAFLSGALGTNNLTGDAYLMGAEVGADLSGMEFSGQYGISPSFSSVTKGIVYFWASFSDESGHELDIGRDRQQVARHLLKGPVYARLDKLEPSLREAFRKGQPNIFVPFDRMNIDPFTQWFPITLRHEGTVRGTGGLVVVDGRSTTSVPGLYAAGDAASRQRMAGAVSGGGGPNASFAMSTGSWAGEDAAAFAQRLGPAAAQRQVRPAGRELEVRAVPEGGKQAIETVRRHMLPISGGFYRNAATLRAASDAFEPLWADGAWQGGGDARSRGRAREALALLATARLATHGARQRAESRGIHRRTDHPDVDPALTREFIYSDLDGGFAHPAPTYEAFAS